MKKITLTDAQKKLIIKHIKAIEKNFQTKAIYSIAKRGSLVIFRVGCKLTNSMKAKGILKDPAFKTGRYICETFFIGPRGGIYDRRFSDNLSKFPKFTTSIITLGSHNIYYYILSRSGNEVVPPIYSDEVAIVKASNLTNLANKGFRKKFVWDRKNTLEEAEKVCKNSSSKIKYWI